MTTIRLAVGGGMDHAKRSLCGEVKPAFLISYVYVAAFDKARAQLNFRDWAMDSGAYTAHNSGQVIDLQDYIAACKQRLATDPQLTEVFSLDVIGDWKASLANTETMWKAGVPAIPTYHLGEPECALLEMARQYPKISIGGAVGFRHKPKWAEQVFNRVWPKKIHGLGFGAVSTVLKLPFHSVDASNWEIQPTAYGHWMTFGIMSVRGGHQDLRAEVDYYLKMEAKAKTVWRREMAILETDGPTIRFAIAGATNARTLAAFK